jgi:hypothetical protein
LVPVRERIRELRDYLFTSAPPPTAAGDETAARLAEEAAAVTVKNGTLTVGLARSAAEFLQGQGVPVTAYGNADRSDYTESLVIVYTSKNFTAETITRLLGLPPTAIVQNPDPQAGTDILVVLGGDCQFVPSVTPTPIPAP